MKIKIFVPTFFATESPPRNQFVFRNIRADGSIVDDLEGVVVPVTPDTLPLFVAKANQMSNQ